MKGGVSLHNYNNWSISLQLNANIILRLKFDAEDNPLLRIAR